MFFTIILTLFPTKKDDYHALKQKKKKRCDSDNSINNDNENIMKW